VFSVPFIIEDNNDNVLLNKYIDSFTQGDTMECNNYSVTDIIEGHDELLSNVYIQSVPNIILNPNGEMRSFGAVAIKESIAFLMERLCSKSGYHSSPDYPYRAADIVADYYMPGFSDDSLKLLALCDMCLQTSNPGVCFVRTMKGVRDGKISFSSPESIYDYFYQQKTIDVNGEEDLFLNRFKELLGIVVSCLESYLRDIKIQASFYKWINNLATFAINWREHDRYFLLKMARYQDLATNGCWGKAIYETGTPLMRNNLEHYFKIPQYGVYSGMDVEYFKGIREIELLFEKGVKICSMYDWCKNSLLSTANSKCQTAPWEKCTEQELCPYALIWKHWNLSGKIPK